MWFVFVWGCFAYRSIFTIVTFNIRVCLLMRTMHPFHNCRSKLHQGILQNDNQFFPDPCHGVQIYVEVTPPSNVDQKSWWTHCSRVNKTLVRVTKAFSVQQNPQLHDDTGNNWPHSVGQMMRKDCSICYQDSRIYSSQVIPELAIKGELVKIN